MGLGLIIDFPSLILQLTPPSKFPLPFPKSCQTRCGGLICRRRGRDMGGGRWSRESRDYSFSAGGPRWWPVGPVSPLRSQVSCLPVLPHTIQSHRPPAACGRRPRCGGRGMRARCTRPGLTAMPAPERSGGQARYGGRCPPRWPAGRAGHWHLLDEFAGHRVRQDGSVEARSRRPATVAAWHGGWLEREERGGAWHGGAAASTVAGRRDTGSGDGVVHCPSGDGERCCSIPRPRRVPMLLLPL
jgi:hypothetical protein